jgi:uncharacterized membrane protein YozB (DUF420 family)
VESKPFTGDEAIRYAYFMILITYGTLAAAIVPLVITTTLLWMCVPVTGVVTYVMLYRMA